MNTIIAENLSSSSGMDYRPKLITHAGQEYLAAVRDQSIWSTFKTKYGEEVAKMTLLVVLDKLVGLL